MRKEFTKKDLLTGDIVVTRCGELGVVFAEKEYILYQNDGLDFFELFADDLIFEEDDRRWDIMKVYRGEALSFYDYDDVDPFYEREDTDMILNNEGDIQEKSNETICSDRTNCSKSVFVIAQGFYGNRTGMNISAEELDGLLLGCLNNSLIDETLVDRSIIRIPETENLVLIFNRYQEEQIVRDKEKYEIKPVAFIPEKNVELYSRCVGCRMNENGEIESLQNEDIDKIMNCLAE